MRAENRKSDVLIMGAGVIGLSCAYFLQRAGKKVRILEGRKVGSGASEGNCGLITPSHAPPLPAPGMPKKAMKMMFDPKAPLRVKPRPDPEFLSWGTRFFRQCNEEAAERALQAKAVMLRASRVLIGKLVEAENLDCQWSTQGMISVCRSEERLEELKAFAEMVSGVGVPSQFLDRASLRDAEPALRDDVVGGVLFSEDAILRPELFVAELARVAQERGVEIEEDCEVKAINEEGGGVHSAYTNKGLFEAEQFVLACGAWSMTLAHGLGLDLPIEAGKGYSLSSNLRPDPCPRFALLLEERSMVVTPWGNGYRLGGTMEFAGMDESLTKARLDALIEGAEQYLVDPLPPGPPKKWAGFRPMTPDDLPYVGRSPHHNNLYLATGHNMLGMSMSASTGRLITEMIMGKKPHIDPSPYDPGRFDVAPEHPYNRLRRWIWSR